MRFREPVGPVQSWLLCGWDGMQREGCAGACVVRHRRDIRRPLLRLRMRRRGVFLDHVQGELGAWLDIKAYRA